MSQAREGKRVKEENIYPIAGVMSVYKEKKGLVMGGRLSTKHSFMQFFIGESIHRQDF